MPPLRAMCPKTQQLIDSKLAGERLALVCLDRVLQDVLPPNEGPCAILLCKVTYVREWLSHQIHSSVRTPRGGITEAVHPTGQAFRVILEFYHKNFCLSLFLLITIITLEYLFLYFYRLSLASCGI